MYGFWLPLLISSNFSCKKNWKGRYCFQIYFFPISESTPRGSEITTLLRRQRCCTLLDLYASSILPWTATHTTNLQLVCFTDRWLIPVVNVMFWVNAETILPLVGFIRKCTPCIHRQLWWDGFVWFRFMEFNDTFNNISVLLVEETGVPWENWRTLSHNVVSSAPRHNGVRSYILIGTDCTGNYKSNYHTITTMTAP